MRVFIHGSCVSRDLLTQLSEHGFELNHYSPRQSLIPLLGTVPDLIQALDTSRLTSRFQRRAAEGTITADVARELDHRHANIDMVLWDITDERLGVYEVGQGYVTRTLELVASGLDTSLQSVGRHIAFGTDEHFHLWSQSTRTWADQLRRRGLADRVVLTAPRWATEFTDGTPTPASTGMDASRYEALATRYYEQVARELPSTRFIGRSAPTTSSRDHRWGPSPFHFSDETNYRMATELYGIAFDAQQEFPPPRPSAQKRGDGTVTVSGRKTWGTQFALHVFQDREPVAKFRYQPVPDFSLDLPPGTYRAKLFHKNETTVLASSSSSFKVPLR
ncbi:DUF6270 domain-containing protein [Oerskovia sp. NPDC056781]|uniref:DUF6270 domain-containing protein n=1 Tax=Oerskovia sp. NPDC056781 TaxID=3345942 RepID=UPI00366BD592